MSTNSLVRDNVRVWVACYAILCPDGSEFNRSLVDGKYSCKRNIEFFVLDDNESDFALADLRGFSPLVSLLFLSTFYKNARGEVKDF